MEILLVNLFLIILVSSLPLIFDKNLTNFKIIHKDSINSMDIQVQRNLDNGNYII